MRNIYEKLKSGDLEFRCLHCGDCCRVSGYVFINRKEGIRLAKFLKIEVKDFFNKYVQSYGARMRIRGAADKACIFLKGRSCTVYAARPSQCRKFPFWLESMSDAESFIETAGFCSGVKKLLENE
ncbi:MAG: YkgJ family cysteine cluster protein [Elusimicrobia bacterium]|nr:YkgJ family cysteine cluster protein [Elusimicrobiota bacterium]